jgi:hypothetical protein
VMGRGGATHHRGPQDGDGGVRRQLELADDGKAFMAAWSGHRLQGGLRC